MAEKELVKGNEAIAKGALEAGCRFYFGYPITPQNDIPEFMSKHMHKVGGTFLQAESEVAAINMVYGAAAAGARAMTSSSSPGISLMQESIGFAAATETPLVIIDVQRFGPSTGVPSVGLAGDIVQVARGSHGDYQIIALCPESPQEMFDLTIRAFNLAETYRVPVFVMADGFMGHMREQIVIPGKDQFKIENRRIAEPAHCFQQRHGAADDRHGDVLPSPQPRRCQGLVSRVDHR